MARVQTNSARYFPLDVDYFSDLKIRRLKRDCGDVGVMMHLNLMCSVYSDASGYYIHADENLVFDFSEQFSVSEADIHRIFEVMIEIGLINGELYKNFSVLTSHSMQKQFQEMIKKKGKRNPIKIDKKYWLLDESETENYIIVLNFDENYTAVKKNNGYPNDTKSVHNDTKTLQNATNKSKGNKSKEKESKLNKNKAAEKVKEDAGDSATATAEKLTAEYEEYIGKASESVKRGIEKYLNAGMEAALLSRLIQYALEMGKCNWQYIKAAADGNLSEGITTLERYNISCEARQKKRRHKKSPFNNYTDTNKPDYSDFGNRIIEQMLRESEENTKDSEREKMLVL